MKRNFNFLIDAVKNLTGYYNFGIFIHENNWKAFNKNFKNALKIIPDSLMETKDYFNINYKDSVINVYKICDSTSQIHGQRYNFIFWDELLKTPMVNEIIRPCATLSPGIVLSLNFREKCHCCICKTCAIAEINGGASGCGNCKDCNLIDGCRSCNEYYNPEPHINDIIDQMLEYNCSSSNFAYVFPIDKNDKVKIKYVDDFIEGEESK